MTLKAWRVINQNDAQTATSRCVSHCVVDRGAERPNSYSIFKMGCRGSQALTRLVEGNCFFPGERRLYTKSMWAVSCEGQDSPAA